MLNMEVKEIVYPPTMINYKRSIEEKIRKINKEMLDRDSLGDIRIGIELKDYCFEAKKEEVSNKDRHLEGLVFSRISNFPTLRVREEVEEYKYVIKLKYDLYLTWKRRPNNYTDYYPLKIQELLREENIEYVAGNISWVEDTSTGQILTQKYNLNCDLYVSEEVAKEIYEEWKQAGNA